VEPFLASSILELCRLIYRPDCHLSTTWLDLKSEEVMVLKSQHECSDTAQNAASIIEREILI